MRVKSLVNSFLYLNQQKWRLTFNQIVRLNDKKVHPSSFNHLNKKKHSKHESSVLLRIYILFSPNGSPQQNANVIDVWRSRALYENIPSLFERIMNGNKSLRFSCLIKIVAGWLEIWIFLVYFYETFIYYVDYWWLIVFWRSNFKVFWDLCLY